MSVLLHPLIANPNTILILFMFQFIAGLQVNGQHTQIDSLRGIALNAVGPAKYDAMVNLIRATAENDLDEGLRLASENNKIALQLGDTSKIVDSYRIMAILLNRTSRAKEIVKILTHAVPMAKRNNLKKFSMDMLNTLAIALTFQAKYDSALKIHLEVLKGREEDKDTSSATVSILNIGLLFYKMKHYSKALAYFENARKLRQQIGDTDLTDLLINIGLCHTYLNNSLAAISCFKEVLRANDASDPLVQLHAHYGLGVVHFNLNNLSDAERHFNYSLARCKEIKHRGLEADNLIFIARIHKAHKKFASAVDALRQCEIQARQSGYMETLITAYEDISQLFLAMENYKDASMYQRKYIDMRDSIYNADMSSNMTRFETDHLERENKARIESQNQLLALNDKIINQQRLVNMLIGSVAVVLILLAVILIRSNKQKQYINQQLDQRVKERTRELEASRDELVHLNREREMILSKISSEIKSYVTSIKGLSSVAILDVQDPQVKECMTHVHQVSEQLSMAMNYLQPPHLEKKEVSSLKNH